MLELRHHLARKLDIGLYSPQPTRYAQSLDPAGVGQVEVATQIVGLVVGGGKAGLALEDPHLVQVHVDDGLLYFSQSEL